MVKFSRRFIFEANSDNFQLLYTTMKNLIKYFCILLCFNCFAQKEQKSLIGRWEHTKYISKHPKGKDAEEIMTKLLKGSILEY